MDNNEFVKSIEGLPVGWQNFLIKARVVELQKRNTPAEERALDREEKRLGWSKDPKPPASMTGSVPIFRVGKPMHKDLPSDT